MRDLSGAAPSRRRGGALLAVGIASSAFFSILMQAIWFIPTTVVGGMIALREVARSGRGAEAAAVFSGLGSVP